MRFVIYKNSILATFCSMFGAAFIAMAVMALISGELGIFSGIGIIAAGLGFMWLGDFISKKKAAQKRRKAQQTTVNIQNSEMSRAQPEQTAQSAQPSSYAVQAAETYPFAVSAVQGKPVKKSAGFVGTFSLIAALLELLSICISYIRIGKLLMMNSEEVALVAMGLLLAIAAFRSRHIQQVSMLFVIGFLGLALGSVDVALVAYRTYGFDRYITSEGIHYAVFAAPALKAAAYFVMCIFALLSTRKIREHCGGIVRWLWFVPMLPLALAYAKEISDDDAFWGIMQVFSRHGGFPGLKNLSHPALLHVYAVVLLGLAVFASGFCFQRFCRKRTVVYTQPELQSTYAPSMQETPVQPQPEPCYAAPEMQKQPEPASKPNNQDVQKQIQAYKDLMDCGILTQEECEHRIRELTQEYYGG